MEAFRIVKRGQTAPVGGQHRGWESHNGHARVTVQVGGQRRHIAYGCMEEGGDEGLCLALHCTGERERQAGRRKAVRNRHTGASIEHPEDQWGGCDKAPHITQWSKHKKMQKMVNFLWASLSLVLKKGARQCFVCVFMCK